MVQNTFKLVKVKLLFRIISKSSFSCVWLNNVITSCRYFCEHRTISSFSQENHYLEGRNKVSKQLMESIRIVLMKSMMQSKTVTYKKCLGKIILKLNVFSHFTCTSVTIFQWTFVMILKVYCKCKFIFWLQIVWKLLS